MTHDGFQVDLGAAATATNATASGVIFHNCTAHQIHFLVVTNPNHTLTCNGVRVEIGSSATATNDTASGVLFHSSTRSNLTVWARKFSKNPTHFRIHKFQLLNRPFDRSR